MEKGALEALLGVIERYCVIYSIARRRGLGLVNQREKT